MPMVQRLRGPPDASGFFAADLGGSPARSKLPAASAPIAKKARARAKRGVGERNVFMAETMGSGLVTKSFKPRFGLGHPALQFCAAAGIGQRAGRRARPRTILAARGTAEEIADFLQVLSRHRDAQGQGGAVLKSVAVDRD